MTLLLHHQALAFQLSSGLLYCVPCGFDSSSMSKAKENYVDYGGRAVALLVRARDGLKGWRKRPSLCSGILLALLCAPFGCKKTEPAAQRPNVVLIVVDTLRADRLGSYGNAHGLTPFLDRLAAGATVFHNTYATSSWTMSSMASLFTSRYPYRHGVGSVLSKLDAQQLTLAEMLTNAGYRSAAFVANPLLSPATGYDQGFDSYQVAHDADTRADHIRQETLDWLDSRPKEESTTPVFLYLHYMEPHWPYSPPTPYRERFLRSPEEAEAGMRKMQGKLKLQYSYQFTTGENPPEFTADETALLRSLYDAEVATIDAELEILFTELEKRNFLKNAVVVFTSDHGEELLDHGNLWHTYTLYEESILVPLIVRVSAQDNGATVDQMVSLIDLAPSLAEVLQLEVPREFEGRSFAAALGGQPQLQASPDGERSRQIFAELELDAMGDQQRRLHSAAIVEANVKVLTRTNGDVEVYDLASDPRERAGQSDAKNGTVQRLMDKLVEIRQASDRARTPNENAELDDATRERLKALGYLPDEGQ